MPLFHISDTERPGYVVASSYARAIEKWEYAVRVEDGGNPPELPSGVDLVCEDTDLIVSTGWVA